MSPQLDTALPLTLVCDILRFATQLQSSVVRAAAAGTECLRVSLAELAALQNKLAPAVAKGPVAAALFELVTSSVSPRCEAAWRVGAATQEVGVGAAAVVDWLLRYAGGYHTATADDNSGVEGRGVLTGRVLEWLRDSTVAGSPVLFALWVAPAGVATVRALVSRAAELAIAGSDVLALEAAAGFCVLLLDAALRLSRTRGGCPVAVEGVEAALRLAMERLPSPIAGPRGVAQSATAAGKNGPVVAARRLLLVVLCCIAEAATAAPEDGGGTSADAQAALRRRLAPLAGLPAAEWGELWRPVLAATIDEAPGDVDAGTGGGDGGASASGKKRKKGATPRKAKVRKAAGRS